MPASKEKRAGKRQGNATRIMPKTSILGPFAIYIWTGIAIPILLLKIHFSDIKIEGRNNNYKILPASRSDKKQITDGQSLVKCDRFFMVTFFIGPAV